MRARSLTLLVAGLCLFAFRAQAAVTEPPVGGGGSCPGATAWDGSQGQQKAYNNGLYTCSGGAWAQEAFIVGSMLQDGTSPACNAAHAGMIKWTGTAFQGCDGSSWTVLGSGGGAAFSGLTGATATNSIDNANYAQAWTWNSLTTETALALSSSSETTGSLLTLNNANTSGAARVFSAATASTTANATAVYGVANGSGNAGIGVWGENTSTTGANFGVYGKVASTNSSATAVYGQNIAASGAGYGVRGTTASTGAGVGVYGSETGASNTGYAVQALNNSTSGWGIYAAGASPNYFAGNVGIGTTAPGGLLDVSSPVNATVTYFRSAAGKSLSINLATNTATLVSDGNLALQTSAAADVVFTPNSAEAMRIKSTGLVGIGTTTPANKLDVAGAIGVTTTTATLPLNGLYSSTTNSLALTTSGVTALTITSTGSIGIGTTTPSGLLTIHSGAVANGTFRVEADTGSEWFSVGRTAGTVAFNMAGGRSTVGAYAGSAARFNVGVISATDVPLAVSGTTSQSGDLVRVDTNGSTGSQFIIKAAGNVGIGTTTPADTLDVAGAIGLTTTTATRPLNGLYSSTTNSLGLTTSGVTALTITSTGSVGIGTANPSRLLHIAGSNAGAAPGIQITETGTNKSYSILNGSVANNVFSIKDDSASAQRLVIDNSGNVGIGTTAPATGAVLDMGANTSSARLPVGTTAQKPTCSSALNGAIRFNSTTSLFEGCDGSGWSTLGSGGGAAFSGLTGATATNSIDNSAYAQTWAWNSLTTQTGLTVSSGSLTTGTLLALANTSTSASGYVLNAMSATTSSGIGVYSAITGHGNTGYAGYFANTDTGADANYGLYATTSSTGAGVGVYAAITGSGNTGAAVEALNSSTSGWGIYAGGTSPNYFNGAVGIGTTAPASGAVLDMGANTSSARLPVGTTGQEPTCSTALKGAIRFNSTTSLFEGCDGTNWATIASSVAAGCTGPNAFSFTNVTNASLSTVYTSNTITPAGCSAAMSVSVSGAATAQISVNGGGWTTSGSITPGQTLAVRLTSSGSASTVLSAVVVIGSTTGTTWTVTTSAGQTQIFRTAGSFNGNLGGLSGADTACATAAGVAGYAGTWKALLSTSTVNARGRLDIYYPVVRASNGTTIASSNLWGGSLANVVAGGSVNVWTGSLSDGTYNSNGSCTNWTTTSGNGEYGNDNITTSNWITANNAACTGSLYLYCLSLVSTTCSAEAFSFTSLGVQPLSTLTTSNTLTPTASCVSGTTSPVSVTGGGSPQISINGGAWASSGTMNPGDTLQVRQTTSASNSTTQTDTITIGNTTGTWSVTTQAAGTQIFTAGTYSGSLGGLSGADADCATAASTLNYGGTWRALLSTSTVNARGRMDIYYPVVRASDGTTTVAASTLWGSALANVVAASGVFAWTGSNADGTAATNTCTNWTTTGGNGELGSVNSTSSTWLAYSGNTPCSSAEYLYCLNQVSTTCSAEAFSFTNQTGASLSTLTTSSTLTPTVSCASGTTSPVSVSGGGSPQISINGGGWASSGTMNPGDTLQVRLTSSASYSTALTATVTIGSTTSNWIVTTAGDCTSSPAVGTVCVDGSVYAGLSMGSIPMYATRCDAGQTWNGAACTGTRSTIAWNNGNSTNYTTTSVTNTSDGKTNTASLVTIDSDSGVAGTQPHQAASYCDALSEDGHTDWYFPAKDELNTLYGNKAAIGNFDTSGAYYWNSTEASNNGAWSQRFDSGSQFNSSAKNAAECVRCVRR